ncbi:MAG: BamA/TamA family outer membrane protein [Acidobacteriia bacterium]|nr:BamA/TamA family outer membrane protein [Terriglobia bacterium]
MIRRFLFLSCLLLAAPHLFSQTSPRLTIRSVQVRGNVRIPAATILHYVSAAPDKLYDEAGTRADMHFLYGLGVFQSLEIQTQEAGEGGIDVIYRVREQPFVSEFVIEGVSEGEQEQIRRLLGQQKLLMQPATPFRPGAANKAANFVRSYLRMHKYPFAQVRVLTEEEREGTARLKLSINAGPNLDVGEVRFSGNRSIPSGDLLKQLQYTRPAPFFAPWLRGAYVAEDVNADLDSLRRYYQSQGFAAASIGTPEMVARDFPRRYLVPLPKIGGSKQKLALLIPIVEGPGYRLVSVGSDGSAKSAAAKVAEILAAVKVPGPYDSSLLEATRQKIVDALGHEGYALAQVMLEQNIGDAELTVGALYRIYAGDPIVIGRIQFSGNTRLRERFLRREVVVREGEIFDSAKLDQSIKRLNRSGMIQEVRRADVALDMNEKTDELDVTFKIKEKERQGIYGTGGTGGIGGGYLGILYSAFDLLGLGESLSLQLDGGAAQSNMVLDIIGSRFLGLPFTLGLSVFHRLTNFNVASVVPNATDLIQVLRRRSTGMALSGAYPVTSKVQVGLGAQFERLSLSQDASAGAAAQNIVQGRTELSPTFVFDSTKGTGPAARGTRFAFTNSWAGTTLLRTVDSTAQSYRFSQYVNDPITQGRNSFAFRFQAAMTRPQNGVPLTLDRRFYPGDEIVRGFARGAMTAWALPTGTEVSPSPVGADTVLGFSMEYRVPIQGPLSAAAFVDLGWSGLSKRNVDPDTSSNLIDKSSRVLRASVGGEFRLQLPVIRQPARLIFSWNPLRLNQLIQNKGSLLRLVDPRGSVHFALGDLF